jgi:hypothetical protein
MEWTSDGRQANWMTFNDERSGSMDLTHYSRFPSSSERDPVSEPGGNVSPKETGFRKPSRRVAPRSPSEVGNDTDRLLLRSGCPKLS